MEKDRFKQLLDAGYPLWVCGGFDPVICPPEHADLDGLILPSGHPFWRRFFPFGRPKCQCFVSGARNERMAVILGGVPGKPLPAWCDED